MLKGKSYLITKRLLDIIFGLILFMFTFPIILLSVFSLKLESKGPAIFKQKRPGRKSKLFKVFKLRTMTVETEKDGRVLTDSERLTKVGNFLRKTSFDELPQIYNIIKGEMSFIGPRPLPISYLPYYTDEENKRHDVLPGISGLAQINGRNLLDWNSRLALDIQYVNNISFFLDLKIFFLTIYKIFKSENVVILDNNPLQNLDVERKGKECR